MNENQVKECPYCKEEVLAEAVRCRYCKSDISQAGDAASTGKSECRDLPGRMVAGVAAYLAGVTGISVSVVRLAFVVGAIFAFPAAAVVYAAVWMMVPFRKGETTAMDRLIFEIRNMCSRHRETCCKRKEDAGTAPETAMPETAGN